MNIRRLKKIRATALLFFGGNAIVISGFRCVALRIALQFGNSALLRLLQPCLVPHGLPKAYTYQCALATWVTQQSLSPFRLCHESFNLPGSVVCPGVPQRSFVRLPDADWPDGGRCCFQLLPQLNCEPVPVRVFFGVVNFRAMHSNIITQFESACLESIHCGFLVILCDWLKSPKLTCCCTAIPED